MMLYGIPKSSFGAVEKQLPPALYIFPELAQVLLTRRPIKPSSNVDNKGADLIYPKQTLSQFIVNRPED